MINSKIEWTDHTVNLWWGCTKVHAGCDNCYAEHFSDVRHKNGLWGGDVRRVVKTAFKQLDKIEAIGAETGNKQRVFVGSMMDIFEKNLSIVDAKGEPVKNLGEHRPLTIDHIRQKLFREISNGKYDNIIFLFLTKRPSNISKYIPDDWKFGGCPQNVWLGASISDQETAGHIMSQLVRYAPIKSRLWLSVEPQIGPIDLKIVHNKIEGMEYNFYCLPAIDWVIQGGESGPNKRPFSLSWADQMRRDCKRSGIPYFFKQIDKVTPIPEAYLVRELPKF